METLLDHYDIVLIIVFSAVHIILWTTSKVSAEAVNAAGDVAERGLAVSATNQALSTGLTAVSLILPITLLVAGLQQSPIAIPPEAKAAVRWSIPWLVLSLVAGLYCLSLVPRNLHFRSVAFVKEINIAAGIQYILLFVGILRLAEALWKTFA